MDWHDDDYDFYEPHGYEDHIETLINEVRNNIKAEVISELETLRADNEKLQDVKRRMDEIEREHALKINELTRAKQDALNTVRRETLKELLNDVKTIVYSATSYNEFNEKCNECDEHRKRHYVTPLGKNASETCDCEGRKTRFKIQEYELYSFSYKDKELRKWYKQAFRDDEDYYNSDSTFLGEPFDETPFEDIESYYRSFFLSAEKCQAYCDWLNEQERIKEESHWQRLFD